ncbi:SAF domain-containing protein OS=Streptomyces tendae OX=1932 GN=F3L20_02710 PE=4 SV=1 [Streptomyces tendae]
MKIQERTGAGAGRSAAPAQPSVGDRLPSPPRERKPALAALAVLLILVGALGATMLVLRAGDRVEVVKVTADIQAGDSVGNHVTSVMVAADDSINYVEWTKVDALKKLKAKSTIYADTVVVGQMFGAKAEVPDGKASVGLALKEGQYYAGIKGGDTVAAYRVGTRGSSGSDSSDKDSSSSSSSGNGFIANASVESVKGESDATVSTGTKSITLLVDEADAAALASASAAGEVAVVRVPAK